MSCNKNDAKRIIKILTCEIKCVILRVEQEKASKKQL